MGVNCRCVDAVFLPVLWGGAIVSVWDVSRYVAIYPYFETRVGGICTFASGYEIARHFRDLDQIVVDRGGIPLSRFGFNDDMSGEKVEWHDAASGLSTCILLLEEIEKHADRFSNHKKLRLELERMCHALQQASERGIRFSLLLRHGDATNAQEWDLRQGTAF